MMATVRHVFMFNYVADIVSNDDNLSYGSIITVSAGPDDHRTAITDRDIGELRDLIPDLRSSPQQWDDFLHSVIDDPQTTASVKAHNPR